MLLVRQYTVIVTAQKPEQTISDRPGDRDDFSEFRRILRRVPSGTGYNSN
jgi:hypothetical protein